MILILGLSVASMAAAVGSVCLGGRDEWRVAFEEACRSFAREMGVPGGPANL